jgi:hypothetical protein
MTEQSDVAAIRQFQKILDTYLKYREEFRGEILRFSFLCISGDRKNEMAEITGLVVA